MRASPALLVVLLAVQAASASPREAVLQALQDAKRLPADARHSTRYLALYAIPVAKRGEFLAALNYGVNSVSREAEIVKVRQVSPDLVAVDLRDYGWKKDVWEKIADVGTEPYFHVVLEEQGNAPYPPRQRGSDGFSWWVWADGRWIPEGSYSHPQGGKGKRISAAAPWLPGKEVVDLIYLSQSQAPVVRADWFLVQISRQLSLNNRQTGIGYYDWLGLKKRDDYFKLIGLDVQASIKVQREVRAAVESGVSGVSRHNRQIVRLQSLTGGAWFTLDTDDDGAAGNATLNLQRGDFRHKAEEHYGSLPNGLPALFLCDAAGARQDSAPDFIGPDDSPLRVGRDARIHVGLACIRCHTDVLRSVDDWARRTYRGDVPLVSPDHATLKELRRQYLSNLDAHLARDRAVYEEAIQAACGLKPDKLSEAMAGAWNAYAETLVSPEAAAREVGLEIQEMRRRIGLYVQREIAQARAVHPDLRNLERNDPVLVPRTKMEELFPLLMSAVGGG